jgi:hypothetical protein
VAGNVSVSAAVDVTVSNWRAPTGLVAAYAFNEEAGTTVVDETGNGHTGALQNGATWTSGGRFGGALSFNGSSGLVTIADAAGLDLAASLTIEAWVYPTVRSNWDTVLLKGAGNATAYALYAGDSAGRPAAIVRMGSKEQSLSGSSVLPLNTWSHLAMTYGAGRLRIYVNGVLVANRALTGNVRKTGDPVTIGGSLVYGRWFAGTLDEVRIYNRELAAAEIQAGMNETIRR